MLGREWRSGELGTLALALVVAVAALTAVGFLVGRIGAAVERQAGAVLAADLRLGSPQPLAPAYLAEARRRGLQTAAASSLLSVVFNGEQSQLTNVEAVTAGYPLRGQVLIADAPFAPGVPAREIPPPGEAWPDSRLLAALSLAPGGRITIGAASLRVGKVLIARPDQSATFADLAPSLLMNAADLPATQLIQPGSRVSHAQLFAGERTTVLAFKAWLASHKRAGERLRDLSETSPQIRDAVERAGRFLNLAGLVSVLLCAISVAMSARRYVQRHLDTVALLKTLGATRAATLGLAVMQLLLIAVVAALAGALLGFGAQLLLLRLLRKLLASTDLPAPSIEPVVAGTIMAIAVLAGFALPALRQLARVPALRVLRRDVGAPPPALWAAFLPAVAVVGALVAWALREPRLFAGFWLGLLVFVLVLAAAGAGLVQLASSFRGRVGVAWRYGLANLGRRRMESVVQIVAFGTGIMVLLLLAMVRAELDRDWRRILPTRVPNYFFVNIPGDQRSAFREFLGARGIRPTRLLPMIRGRLTAIGGRPVESLHLAQSGENFATREQNLTWADELGADNRIVSGRWWTAADRGRPLVSLATEFQESLGLQVGDELSFDIAGETVVARVASIRKVKWDSFQPNFFIVFPPGVLDKVAGTWLTSAWLDGAQARSLVELAHRFPSVSIFDIDQILTQVRAVLDRALLAVQSVFAFTLLAGFTVLLAAVQSSRDERCFESAVLRTLGASRNTILAGVLAEFLTLGGLAGSIAGVGASIAAWLLAHRLLQLGWSLQPITLLAGVLGGALLVAAAGSLATRAALRQPPLAVLRG